MPEYICHRHRTNGTCTNALRMPVADMNEAVLQAVEEHALTPEAIEQVIHLTERDDVADQQAALARERKDVEKRIARLVAAIETGGDAASLVAKLRELEARQRAIARRGRQPAPGAAAGPGRHRESAGGVAAAAARVDDAGAHGAAAHAARAADVHAAT